MNDATVAVFALLLGMGAVYFPPDGWHRTHRIGFVFILMASLQLTIYHIHQSRDAVIAAKCGHE
jgi:hypothetical protein